MASAQSTTAPDKAASDKAAAYYNFAMAHLYAEQAGQFGNRSEFVNKAIDYYRQALKLDPSASYIFEELTDLYIQTGHIRDAVTEAQDMLKRNGGQSGCAADSGPHLHAHDRRRAAGQDQRGHAQAGDRAVQADHRARRQGHGELAGPGPSVPRCRRFGGSREVVQTRHGARSRTTRMR